MNLILFSSPRTVSFKGCTVSSGHYVYKKIIFSSFMIWSYNKFNEFRYKVKGMKGSDTWPFHTWKGLASYWCVQFSHCYRVASGAMDKFTSRPRLQVFKVHLDAATCLILAQKASQMTSGFSDWHPTSKNTFHYLVVLFTIMIFLLLIF